MSKYVDKMNLPQYRYYNHMVGDREERKELISDLLAAEMILERGSKKERSQPRKSVWRISFTARRRIGNAA